MGLISKRAGIALAAVAAAILVVTPPSGARVVADSEVTISRFLPLYHGKVRSTFARCRRGRRVVLFRKQPGRDEKIGRDRTNRKGKWREPAPGNLAPGDRFYARVRPKDVSSVGTGLVCTGAKSRTVTFVGD